jgi:hypothetical protein
MIRKLKNQSLKKLLIILYNLFRMSLLTILHPIKFRASLIQNINPTSEIALGGAG